MKPRTPLPPRKSRIARKAPVKKRNPKRRASEWLRAYDSPARVRFVNGLPCVATKGVHFGPMQNAHTETGGIGRKGPFTSIVPACWGHHMEMHHGQKSFEARHGVKLKKVATETENLWQEHKERAA